MKAPTLFLSALAFAVALGCSNDHVPDIGASCNVGVDAGLTQATYNVAAECSTRMCLKPAAQPGAASPSTEALCTATCSNDSDCEGQLRDPTNPADTRCMRGFTCGVAFVAGDLCCKKLCICRDFLGAEGAKTPAACSDPSACSSP